MGNQPQAGIEKQQLDSFLEKDKLYGFVNINNICYMNSVMQCLFSCKSFRKQVLNLKQLAEETSMLKAINELFLLIETKKKKTGVLDTKKFIQSVKKNNQDFNNEDHHDSHEFLIWLLDTLNENMKSEYKKMKIMNSGSGRQSSIIKCLNCENVTERSESYLNLSVDVEQNTSLTFCLKKYISKEILRNKDKFYCNVCNSLQEAERQVLLETLPKVLIVHLKRFKITDYSQQKKLNYAVNIPNDICLDFLLKDKEKYTENTLYNLSAIVVHVGTGNEYGHYYCLTKISGKWVKFDDENVNLFEKKDLLEFFGNPDEEFEFNNNYCAYLLFYELSE